MIFVVVGNPGGRRVELFQAALARLGRAPAQVVGYADLLAGRAELAGVIAPGALLRIDSPGKDFAVERAILALGADRPDDGGYARLPARPALALPFDKGRILYPRQWYRGFCALLAEVERQRAPCPPHTSLNDTAEIALLFDKPRCHAHLAARGIPVPPSLGPVRSYEGLRARMRERGCRRVFVKLAHGSSASGVVAYRTQNGRHRATTTVEMVRRGGALYLYNSRAIRTYDDPREIARLVDALCRHHVHVERWIPKAGLGDRAFDLRVVTIAGRARHVVARLSASPMTNLHLLNARSDAAPVRDRMGAAWDAALATCERVAAAFPGSLHLGIDLLITPDFRSHAVLEVNAFGDLLPGVLDGGVDTYTAEILALEEKARVPA